MNADAAPIRLTFSLFSDIVLFAQRSVRRFKLQTRYGALIVSLITEQLQKGEISKGEKPSNNHSSLDCGGGKGEG
jgi:hypothetical protein